MQKKCPQDGGGDLYGYPVRDDFEITRRTVLKPREHRPAYTIITGNRPGWRGVKRLRVFPEKVFLYLIVIIIIFCFYVYKGTFCFLYFSAVSTPLTTSKLGDAVA